MRKAALFTLALFGGVAAWLHALTITAFWRTAPLWRHRPSSGLSSAPRCPWSSDCSKPCWTKCAAPNAMRQTASPTPPPSRLIRLSSPPRRLVDATPLCKGPRPRVRPLSFPYTRTPKEKP